MSLTPSDLRLLMAAAEHHPGETTEQLRARAHAEDVLQSWRAWLSGLLDGDRRLLADLSAVRAHHAFTAERIGQPGCPVRLKAAEFVATLDAAIASLSPIAPDSQSGTRAPAAIRPLPAGAHLSEVSQ